MAARYDAALAGLDGMEPAPRRRRGAGDRHAYQAYIARAPDRATRDRLIAGLRERGVESPDRHLPRARHRGLPRARLRPRRDAAWPCDAAERGLALPLYESLREDEQDRVIAALADVLAERPVGARA